MFGGESFAAAPFADAEPQAVVSVAAGPFPFFTRRNMTGGMIAMATFLLVVFTC